MIYLYFELPYWRMSIVTGMYLYFELPYWWMSIVTGMAALNYYVKYALWLSYEAMSHIGHWSITILFYFLPDILFKSIESSKL